MAHLITSERSPARKTQPLGRRADELAAFIAGINLDLSPTYGRNAQAAQAAWSRNVEPILRKRFPGTADEAEAALTAAGKKNPTTLLAIGAIIVRSYLDAETFNFLTAPFVTLGSTVTA